VLSSTCLRFLTRILRGFSVPMGLALGAGLQIQSFLPRFISSLVRASLCLPEQTQPMLEQHLLLKVTSCPKPRIVGTQRKAMTHFFSLLSLPFNGWQQVLGWRYVP
jgi:hypothetical protein